MTDRVGRRLRRARGDEGFTLMEMMVVVVVLGALLAVTVPILSTVMQTTSRIRLTYTNLDSQLWLSTNLQRLLRAAVAPAPAFDGTTPTTQTFTPFVPGAVTPTSLTFFANTGTPNGPEEVKASCTQTTTDKTLCAPSATFTLTLTPPKVTTCPFVDTTIAHSCTWPSTKTRTLLSIPNVTNGDSASAQPLFTYSYGSTTVCSAGTPGGCSGSDSTTFSTAHCHSSSTVAKNGPFATCPAGEIDDVSYALEFNAKLTKSTKSQTTARYGGLQAKTVSGTFVMSSTSVLYNPTVG